MRVYEAIGWTPTGNVAVKLSTGEPPASNYLRPELIIDLVQSVDGTIADVDIPNADGSVQLVVTGGSYMVLFVFGINVPLFRGSGF